MANLKSSKKQAVQAEKRRAVNLARKTQVKTAIKKVLAALEKPEDAATLKSLLADAEAKIARAKSKGVLHANTASRKVSRLASKVAAATR